MFADGSQPVTEKNRAEAIYTGRGHRVVIASPDVCLGKYLKRQKEFNGPLTPKCGKMMIA